MSYLFGEGVWGGGGKVGTRSRICQNGWDVWDANFTYIGKETTYITNIFKRTELKITFRTTNTLASLLTHKDRALDKYSLSGVYKLTCPDCHKTYVGQTGQQFSTCYKEHKTSWRNHSTTSNFALHLIDETHSFGPMHQIMDIVHYHKKGAHLNTLERLHIHTESVRNNHLSDPQTIHPNAIFDTLCKTVRPTDRSTIRTLQLSAPPSTPTINTSANI